MFSFYFISHVIILQSFVHFPAALHYFSLDARSACLITEHGQISPRWLLNHRPPCVCLPAAVPEPAWKEALSASYSSSTSGNWSWDASDQSVPSTPSPPLSNDANKSFLLSSQGDDVNEDGPESTHFLFEDPIPRKRKVNMET